MKTDNKTIKITKLIINALDYAHNHNLDINNNEDLKIIFEALDPQHTNDIGIEEFTNLIQNADSIMKTSAFRLKRRKTNLPN